MDKLLSHLSRIRIPAGGDKIYKDECMFSFDNPETDTGLYVCLNSFLGFGKDFVTKYYETTQNCVFLHIHHIKKKLPPDNEHEPEKKIARLAIGIEGGFNPDASKNKYEVKESHSIVILPEFQTIPFPNLDLPDIVNQSVSNILKAESALHLAELEAAAQAWDGEIRMVTKHAETLQQLNNGIQIPSSGWKCELCEKTDNLWLNLTDGTIMCGRKQLDGSGGNNHAVDHYQSTGYPLSVKLGTITPDGKGDVYSYQEDDMVLDPHLAAHLAHFGINVSVMEKTEKTMLELEIEYNQRAWEWSRLTESGSKLCQRFGPGYTGLRNLGNSCYLNSVMQILMTVPSFIDKFYNGSEDLFKSSNFLDAPSNFNIQISKLAVGLLSGRYSKKPEDKNLAEENVDDDLQPGISPVMFRTLVGKGHQEFSTKKQQDAMEFLEHILKLVNRNAAGASDPSHAFKFQVEDKFVCCSSGKVRYVTRDDIYLPLPVPLDAVINKEEVAAYEAKRKAQTNIVPSLSKEQVPSKIPFSACLARLVESEEINAFSSAVGKNVPMQKITRLVTFPDFLVIQLVKFGVGPGWQPVKYDVSISMPDELDLSVLKGSGQQPGEELLSDEAEEPSRKSNAIVVDESVVANLAEMGFPIEACRKAVYLTGNSGSELATNWIMEHMCDPDFAIPLSIKSNSECFTVNEEGLGMLMSMGFTKEQSTLALKETSNNLERAADWIFSHQLELDFLVAAANNAPGGSKIVKKDNRPSLTDGPPRYELVGLISHMGTSIFVGHYVCHIKRDGEWSLFNDNKVFKSENPPKDLGYIYLYKRIMA